MRGAGLRVAARSVAAQFDTVAAAAGRCEGVWL